MEILWSEDVIWYFLKYLLCDFHRTWVCLETNTVQYISKV